MFRSANNSNEQALTEALERVNTLDLKRITQKVGQKLGWDAERANKAEQQYRHYLALLLVYPDQQIAPPSNDADEIWHGHILDTLAYHIDCQCLFGSYLHHCPSYGTAQEKLTMAHAREMTEALYERHFGPNPKDAASAEAFCVCMAEPADQARTQEKDQASLCFAGQPRKDETALAGNGALCFAASPHPQSGSPAQEVGCVPCFAKHQKEAGCVPCLGRRESNSKADVAVAAL